MTEYIFSYGTPQNKKVQVALFGRTLQGSVDSLRGYKISIIEIKDEVFLAKGEDKYQRTLVLSDEPGDFIRGTVLAITETELLSADKYEPDGYERIKVRLESGKEAWIYKAKIP